MRKCSFLLALSLPILSASAVYAGVTISSPGSGSSVQSPIHFVASSTTSCSKGVASMGIYDNNVLKMTSKGSKLDTNLSLSSGAHNNTVVQYWDYCGGSEKKQISLNVTTTAPDEVPDNAKTFWNLEEHSGWIGYGELPPRYDICTDCRPKVTWGFVQGVTNPVLSGKSMRFDLGGSTPYADALFVNHLIGDGSTTGQPDRDGNTLRSIHNLIYEVDFYSDHVEKAHAIEFDLGFNVDGRAHMFGTECRTEAKKVWAVWDNPGHRWVDTDMPCEVKDGQWNHLVIKFQRTSDNQLFYEYIELNGKRKTLNWKNNSIPSSWHGLVVNFQLDGNKYQEDYSVFLDKLNITYY
jgi:hypothetical protein